MATASLEPTNEIGRFKELDPALFDFRHDVPVFSEHEIEEDDPDNPGQKRTVHYGFDELSAVCRNVNKRIFDTGDYVAIVLGHTPTPEAKEMGAPMPKLVGFAGPFKMGIIGDTDPRWAIIAENWATFKSDADEVKRHPRRSVEMYELPDLRDRFFDPVSILGAETPRLPLGIAYCDGRRVRRYAMATAAAPSGVNTFIPSDRKDKTTYQQEPTSAMSDDDIQRMLAAIMELEPMKWVMAKMEEEQAKGDETEPDGDEGKIAEPEPTEHYEMPESEGEPKEAPQPEAKGPKLEGEGKEVTAQGTEAKAEDRKEEEPKKEKEEYAMPAAQKARYEMQLRAQNDRISQMETQLAKINAEKVQAQRYSLLTELHANYTIDLDDEVEQCKGMTEAEFTKHIETVQRYAMLRPTGRPWLPVEEPKAHDSKDPERKRNWITNRMRQYANAGKTVTYDELSAEYGKANGATIG